MTTQIQPEYRLAFDEHFPFNMRIYHAEEEIVVVNRCASSSRDRTLSDVRTACHWEMGKERDEIIAAIAQQEQELQAIVAACNSHEALRAACTEAKAFLATLPGKYGREAQYLKEMVLAALVQDRQKEA